MNKEDIGAFFEEGLAGWDSKPVKPTVRRKGTRTLRGSNVDSAADSLFRAEEHIGRAGDNVFHWKWVVICLQNSLYTFALTVAAGSNPHTVMKDGRVVDFLRAVKSCSGVKRFCHSVPFEITRDQKNSVLWLHKHLRNKFEHFSPRNAWWIELSGLPNMCIDALEAIKFLALDGGNIVYHTKAKEKRIGRSIKKSIEALRFSALYARNGIKEHPDLAKWK